MLVMLFFSQILAISRKLYRKTLALMLPWLNIFDCAGLTGHQVTNCKNVHWKKLAAICLGKKATTLQT